MTTTASEKELTGILEQLGFRRITAAVVAWLVSQKKEAYTAREIERGADLRQPEVSIAMSYLLERGWAKVVDGKPADDSECVGRPVKVYCIAHLDEIYLGIQQEQLKVLADRRELLEKLRSAMISPKPVGE